MILIILFFFSLIFLGLLLSEVLIVIPREKLVEESFKVLTLLAWTISWMVLFAVEFIGTEEILFCGFSLQVFTLFVGFLIVLLASWLLDVIEHLLISSISQWQYSEILGNSPPPFGV